MRAIRPIATACLLAGLLCAGAFAYANLAGGVGAPKLERKHRPVTLSGSIENLHPGMPTVLRVKARNNLMHRVEVRSIYADVGDASPACPQALMRMEQLHGRRGLPPRRTRKIAILVTLAASTPDECQNALFPIKYRARVALRKNAH
jgi:hypothetical protein